MTTGGLESVQAITFDMYGTLLDLEASFGQGIGEFLKDRGSSQNVAQVLGQWEAVYLRESMADTMMGRGRTSFERLRREGLGEVLSRLGVAHTMDDVEALITTRAQVSLYPDVLAGISALRKKFTLAILSNGDRDALERAVDSLEIPIDRIISAEQVGVYKAHAAVYSSAAENLNVPVQRILHVASHPWDVRGAKAAGMLGAYVNREGIPYTVGGSQPDLETATITGLAEALGA